MLTTEISLGVYLDGFKDLPLLFFAKASELILPNVPSVSRLPNLKLSPSILIGFSSVESCCKIELNVTQFEWTPIPSLPEAPKFIT